MAKDFYAILELRRKDNPSGDEIKKAYRRLALLHHPDKSDEPDAEERFKEIYRAYDVLSSEDKRLIYDQFGEKGLDEEGYGGDWSEETWRGIFGQVTTDLIDEFFAKYKGSDEERDDLKGHYERFRGDFDKISEYLIGYEVDEEDRYRSIVQGLIDAGEVKPYPMFVNEDPAQREKRRARAKREAREAEKFQKQRQQRSGKKQGPSGSVDDGMAGLALALRQKAKEREAAHNAFLDNLAAKYGGGEEDADEGDEQEESPRAKRRKPTRPTRKATVAGTKHQVGSKRQKKGGR